MNYEATILFPLYKELNNCKELENGTKELLHATVDFDMTKTTGYIDFDVRKSSLDYLRKEKDWYLKKTLSIHDGVDDIKIWQQICDDNGEINSNYGNLVYSRNNFSQFSNCLNRLKKDCYSREAIIIYTRPSIQLECDSLNAHDFICTLYQQFFIRDNKLHCITNMRSNDCIFGTLNDLPWFEYVYNDMFSKLKESYTNLEKGNLTFTANSFHVYKRHFDVLSKIVESTN